MRRKNEASELLGSQMIFADVDYPSGYEDFHGELVSFLNAHFAHVESGLQGDSYCLVLDGGEKVSIDTFSSMKHQVKSAIAGPHVQKVISTLQLRYKLKVYKRPEPEAHEDN